LSAIQPQKGSAMSEGTHDTNDGFSLQNFPSLKAYIDGIGAEQINFKKYLIKEYTHRHYYVERSYIRITDDGDVIAPEEYMPTAALADRIKQEIVGVKDWPRVIPFNESSLRKFVREKLGDNKMYRFYIRGEKLAKIAKKNNTSVEDNMIMVQVRYDRDDGSKNYKPWSFFSDGKWRMMEPDDKLPFFKPQSKTRSNKIMLHEGPKAAAAAQQIVDDYEHNKITHPWAKELSEYEHWGIIGGALATHRSDYAELQEEKVKLVVYMCDNDELGKGSVGVVSQNYGRKMSSIQFDDRWPSAWDIADPMPEEFFDKENNRYCGPTIKSLLEPATWATKEIPNPDGKKKLYELTDAFMESWVFCNKPKMFINIDRPSYCYNEEGFDDWNAGFSHVKKTSELLKAKNHRKVGEIMYAPGEKPGIFNTGTDEKDHLMKFNMHVAPNIEKKKGDNKLWTEFLEHLFPDEEDRYQVMRWIATLIARPKIKINYAVLLISETQGVGKSTLGSYVLEPILGENNVSYPNERTITESNFNSWQAHKRLAVVNEIYAGHSYKAYNELKHLITEPTIEVNEKYQPTYNIANWCHILACSNDERAIKFTVDDRRWLVPLVTEKKWKPAMWDRFHKWLKLDGLKIIKQWAEDFVASDPANVIMPGEEAPMTNRKKSISEVMLSEGERLVLDRMKELAETMVDEKGDQIDFYVTVHDLREYVREEIHQGRKDANVESGYRLKKLLKSHGFHALPRMKCDKKVMTEVITNKNDFFVKSQSEMDKVAKRVAWKLGEGLTVRLETL
jgi:hypothetical protein